MISDNDYAGDPDGLVQLAHQTLSPSAQLTHVLATPHAPFIDIGTNDLCSASAAKAREVLALTGYENVPVVLGSNEKLQNRKTPIDSPAARAIIEEAMRTDTDIPLFLTAGAGLGAIASAWLMEPRIAERLTLIWIGGHEHKGQAEPPPEAPDLEYNLSIDPIAGQVVFNDSNLDIWQVPRATYRQAMASRAELQARMLASGRLGQYLFKALGNVAKEMALVGRATGEVYVLGDSPLVLLSTLQATFEPTPASSSWITKPCPIVLDSGLYEENPDGKPLRVFTSIDNRLMFADLFAKLELHALGDD